MLNKLELDHTPQTPFILFDTENQKFVMEGVSMPEDAIGFFNPIFEWLANYKEIAKDDASFEIKLKYFNTASAKMIIELCKKVTAIKSNKIIWVFEDDDEDLEEVGEDLKELIGDAFVLKPIDPE